MHGKSVIIMLISLKITCLQTTHLLNSLRSEKHFFYKINTQLHILTNQIFKTLNLGQEFTKTFKTQGLLSMHSDHNIIAEEQNHIYDDVLKAAEAKVKINDTYGLEKIFEDIIEDIIQEETDQLKNDKIEYSASYTSNIKLSLSDIANVSNDTLGNKNEKLTSSWRKTLDIKVWQPLISKEDIDTVNGTRRIYKGKNTQIKKYPFLVSIHAMNEFMCAGSIISKDLVITAATCLQIAYNNGLSYKNTQSIFARVGSDYTRSLGELIPIVKIFFHPGYDPVTLKNNIAIAKMSRRLKFSKKRKIKRIQYDRNGDILSDNVNGVTVLGWGAKAMNGVISQTQKLTVARLDIYNIGECKDIYSRYYVTDTNFCAGFVSKGGGACNRDVGGPGIVSGELVGIVSFGPLVCGMTNVPIVFTKLGFYADWIHDIIHQKSQMRIVETTSMTPKRPLETSPLPLLTTTGSADTDKSNLRTEFTESGKKDDALILKEILQEMLISNNSILDYILYEETPDYENVKTKILSSKENVYHYQPAHKSKKSELRTEVVDDNSSTNYEDVDIGVKILESLIGYNNGLKKTTAKVRFDVQGNKELDHKTIANVIYDHKEHTEIEDPVSRQLNDPNDSNSYYDEDDK